MMHEDLHLLSNRFKIPLNNLKNIEIPEGSTVITSIVDYSSSVTENSDDEQLADDTEDQYLYEIDRVEYICQDCGESFDTPDLHRQHELSTHMNIKVEDVFDFQTFDTNEEISEELYGKYALRSRSRTTKCLLCNEEFPDKDTLRSHEEIHQKCTQYFCSTCRFTSSTSEEFKKHLDQHEYDSGFNDDLGIKIEDSNDLMQPIYQGKIDGIKKLNVSIKTNKKVKYLHCKLCKYKTRLRLRLEKHQLRHQNSEFLICEDCGQGFKLKESLEKHWTQFHMSEIRCRICKKKMVDEKHLRIHMKSHKDGVNYCCDVCKYKTQRLQTLEKHKSRHLKSHSLKFESKSPQKQSVDKKNSRFHMINHKEKNEKQFYRCDVCKYETKRLYNLRKHESQHLRSNSFICDHCGRSFKSKKNLEIHLASYHNSESECPICQIKIADGNGLKLHMRSHREIKYYYCDLCQYKAREPLRLKKHKIQHLRSKFYTCEHCGKLIKSKQSVKIHLASYHSSEFKCQICYIKAADKKSLQVHMKSHKNGIFYCCNVCNYKVRDLWKLKKHQSKHLKSKCYICDLCGRSTKSKKSLENHLASYHNSEFKCQICQIKVIDKKSLQVHMKSHKKGLYYCCNICNYKVPDLWKFKKHQSKHLKSKCYICDHCGRSTETKMSLENHLALYHSSEFKCQICQIKVIDKKSLQVHMKSHKKGLYYCCNICNYKVLDLWKFKKHQSKHLKSKCYICDHCGRSTETKMSLENHLALYHSSEFKCQICQIKVIDKNGLRLHMKSHKNGIYYYCNLCNYKVPDLWKLRQHKNQHLKSKCYICDHCGRSTKSKKALKNHLIFYHDSEFQCQICQTITANQDALRLHMKIHRNKNYYCCNICSYKTLFPFRLVKHKNQHVKTETYNCNNCDKSFQSNSTLKRHMRLCRS